MDLVWRALDGPGVMLVAGAATAGLVAGAVVREALRPSALLDPPRAAAADAGGRRVPRDARVRRDRDRLDRACIVRTGIAASEPGHAAADDAKTSGDPRLRSNRAAPLRTIVAAGEITAPASKC